jgi:Tol biopolymer transport system component
MVGQRLLHYDILERLGEGGMGVVYKARDTHLDRFVAIKVLPPEKVADPARKLRFVQEAKAASALNHPNIIVVHDIAQVDGVDIMVLEYLAGKTLDQVIPRKGMRVGEALKISAQIADALATAHAAGIIHRDLKPSNVMVGEHGHVKVLDFGLAKLTELGGESGECASTRTLVAQTEEGTIVGTVAYMSPEQAEGKPLDARSDIFSFGAVLYEMLCGHRAFQSESKLATLATILQQEPVPLSTVAEGVPRELEKLVLRCLRKDPERRAQHAADLRLALEEIREESGPVQPAAVRTPPRRVPWLAVSGLVVLVAAIAALTWWLARSPKPAPALVMTRLTADAGLTTDPALSPDGKLLAYASDRSGDGSLDIWLQQVAGGEPIRLTRDPADERDPSFSSDGSKIAFHSDREGGGVYVMPALGGEARLIAKAGHRPVFSPDDKWIAYWAGIRGPGDPFAPGAAQSYVVAATGGAPRQLRPEFSVVRSPIWAPDGKHLLAVGKREASSAGPGSVDWCVIPLEGGQAVDTGAEASFRSVGLLGLPDPGVWLPDGRVFFAAELGDGRDLWQLTIAPGTGKASALPVRITTGTGLSDQPSAAVGHDASSTMRLASVGLTFNLQIWSLPLNANGGKVTGELRQVTDNQAQAQFGSLSADGTRLVFARGAASAGDIWLRDLANGRESDLTPLPGDQFHPRISSDGSKVVYNENKDGKPFLFTLSVSRAADGTLRSSGAEKLCEDCQWPWQWTPDGNRVLFASAGPGRRRIGVVTVGSGEKMELISHAQYNLYQANSSPDGRWVAFLAKSQRSLLYIAPFPATPAVEQDGTPGDWISVTDGEFQNDKPRWSPDGNLLYFISNRDGFLCLWAQRLDPASKRPVGPVFAVCHLHKARRSMANVGLAVLETSVARDKIVFNLAEYTGNVWMAEWKER